MQEGAIAALIKIADELGIKSTIDERCPKRRQGMTVGDYVLIAALNRAIAATSKAKMREWVDSTALDLYMRLDREKLDSQNFWDHFDKLKPDDVANISDAIAARAVDLEKIPLDCLVYDTTNYYNYWDVTNPSTLAKMTKSKDGKHHLRHIGLAVAVDRDFGLPLFHRLYPANEHDSKVIRDVMDDIFTQISKAASDKQSATLVFDKGNNSEELILKLDESRHSFVGSRSPFHHKDLCRIPLDRFQQLAIPGRDEIVPVFETRTDLYGHPRRVLVVFNKETHDRQVHRMEQHLEQAKKEISTFKRKAKEADGRSTIESIERQAKEIADHFHVNGLLDIEVTEEAGAYRVSARKNAAAIDDAKTRMGKQILFTNRESITTGEVVAYYRDRAIVEEAFRITKSDQWVKMDPAFHWTDSKIRVHALTCVIALLLVRIAHKRARQNGFEHGVERMMELLTGVRTALVFYPQSSKPSRVLCNLSPEQKMLLTSLACEIPDRR